jgi:hypothetical protein
MKLLPTFLIAVLLTACGKSTPPVPPATTATKARECSVVTVLYTDGNITYMEVDGETPKARMARAGKWGAVGDRFKYCE